MRGRAFAAAIKDEQFDLIFTGLQSDDYGYAQTGVILAELLGWPHATIIMQIEKSDSGIRVKRELEAGYFQFVDMPLPAVLTIQSGINKLRYATLIGIKQAKNKPLRKVAMAEVQSAAGAMGRACATRSTGGGSDANVFVERGLEVANLACGMREIHTTGEWLKVSDMVAAAEVTLAAIQLAADWA